MTGIRTLTTAVLLLAPLAPLEAQRGQQNRRGFSDERRRIDTIIPFNKAGKIELEVNIGDIRVAGWARNEVKIVASTEGSSIDAQWNASQISLTIARGGRARYDLMVPIGVSVTAEAATGTIIISGTKGEVFVTSRSASVEVSDVVGRGEFEIAAGRMTLQRLDGPVSVSTLGGQLSITEAKGELEVEVIGEGTTRIDRADLRTLEFNSVAGGLDFSGTLSAEGRHRIETTAGGVTLRFPDNFGATFEIETWNGQFYPEDFPVTLQPGTGAGRGRNTQRQQFTINGGGARVSIVTNSGDVYLRKIGAPARRER